MATIGIGHHLWLSWLQIASDHARDAEQHRTRSLKLTRAGDEPGPARTREMQNAMVAISASAHAIDGLYGEVKPLISVPPTVQQAWETANASRHARLCDTFKAGCNLGNRTNQWPRQFKELYRHRDRLVHHALRVEPPVPHPGDPLTYVGQDMADYTLESARRSVDLAYDVALTTLRHPKAPDLARWARSMGHVPEQLEHLQTTGRSESAQ